MDIEHLILKNLIYNETYIKKVLPFLKEEYFKNRSEKILFELIYDFISKYNSSPTYESLIILLNELSISEDDLTECKDLLSNFEQTRDVEVSLEWLIDKTEEFCKDAAIYNAIKTSIQIIDGKEKSLDKGSIPQLLQNALAVDFNVNIGHDLVDDWESRFEYYSNKATKYPFELDILNRVTNDGVEVSTLNMFLGQPHSGKTLCMCSLAASYLMQGKNVLYITLEMSDYKIAERIDANLFNIHMDDIRNVPKETFERKINKLKTKAIGKLKIKEYPSKSVNANHFRVLLNELNLKQNFVPDVIFVDYLNLCLSSLLKVSDSGKTYQYVSSIATELRGLAQERQFIIWTATQVNREGSKSTDLTFADTSESFGITGIVDLYWGLIITDSLKALNQILVKQMKNRYKDLNFMEKFVIGVDRPKMRLYEVDDCAQDNVVNADMPYISKDDDKPKKFDDFKF